MARTIYTTGRLTDDQIADLCGSRRTLSSAAKGFATRIRSWV